MTPILFRAEAEADLCAIVAYYQEVAPEAVERILEDIRSTIGHLQHFPFLGMRVDGRSFRRIVTRKYHFKIAYDLQDATIVILGVFRYQDRIA